MNDIKQNHHESGDPNGGPIHHGHPPYWRRAHRDWRVWIGVALMLAAIMIYLMTFDLGGWSRNRSQQPLSGPIAK